MFEKVPSIDKAPTVDKKIELPQNCPYLLQKINTDDNKRKDQRCRTLIKGFVNILLDNIRVKTALFSFQWFGLEALSTS